MGRPVRPQRPEAREMSVMTGPGGDSPEFQPSSPLRLDRESLVAIGKALRAQLAPSEREPIPAALRALIARLDAPREPCETRETSLRRKACAQD